MSRPIKFTLVQNPFNRPIEEVQMAASTIPFMFERYGLIGVLTSTGKTYTYDEYEVSDSKGPENMSPCEPLWLNAEEYNYDNINLSTHPNGWLAFYETHSRVRKGLYHIFMQLCKLPGEGTLQFYSIKFKKTEVNNYIGFNQRETTIKVGTVPIHPRINESDVCRRIDGGGGADESYSICPIPPEIELYRLFVYLRKNTSVRKYVKCIITSNNYYYGFDDSANIIRGEGPIITKIFDEFPYNMLVMDNVIASPEEPHFNRRKVGDIIIPQIASYLNTPVLLKVMRQSMRLYTTFTHNQYRRAWVHLYDLLGPKEQQSPVMTKYTRITQIGLRYNYDEVEEQFIL